MKDFRTLARGAILVLTLLIAGIGAALPAAASAAQANSYTYVSRTTGETVAWSAPWAYNDQYSSTTAGSEVAMFSSDVAATMLGFLPAGIDMNQARDTFLAEFQRETMNFRHVDRGSYSNVSYSLDMATVTESNGESVEFGFFTLFLGNTGNGATEVQLFMAPIEVFTQGLNSATSSMTVGGSPVFNGVKPAGLQRELSRYAGARASGSQTSDTNANQGGAAANTNAPAAGGLGGGLQIGGHTGTNGNAGNQGSNAGSDTFTDPTYGYNVQWTSDWTAKKASSGLTLTSDANGAVALFDGIDTGGNSVTGAADRFPSAYVQSDKLVENARLVGSTSDNGSITFVVAGTINGTPVAEVVELVDQPDLQSAVMIRVVAPQSALPNAAQAFMNDVTVNGQPVLTGLNNLKSDPLDAPSG